MFVANRVVNTLGRLPRNVTTSYFHARSSSTRDEVVIVSVARTPITSMKGRLAGMRAPQLGQHAVRAAMARSGLRNDEVDAVYFGSSIQAGLGQDLARQCAILAGLPETVSTCTINKVCASGMKAILVAAESIACDSASIVIAGGAESMSNAPMLASRTETSVNNDKLLDSVLIDGLNDAFFHCHSGVCAENIATKFSITREMQDEYTATTYKRAIAAQSTGIFAAEIEPIHYAAPGKEPVWVKDDEEIRRVRFEKIKVLLPVFKRVGGTITAANSSKRTDGAAACVMMSATEAKKRGVKPLARIVTFAEAGCGPMDFPVAPLYAIEKAMKRGNLKLENIARWEINEAFACAVLAITKKLELDMAKVNTNGGSVALGHPLGMTGTRIVNHLALSMKPGELGCAAICNGGGGGAAIVVEKL